MPHIRPLSEWLLTAAGNKALHEVWDKMMQQMLIYNLIDAIGAGDVAAARAAARALTNQTVLDLGFKGPV